MAPLTKEHILSRVERHERKRAGYVSMAQEWERMWKLDPGFDRSVSEAIEAGQEQIVLPTPFNIINLSQRLLSGIPQNKVLPQHPGEDESEKNAEIIERFLTAMWKRINQAQGRNVRTDVVLYSLLRGRFAIEVKWIKDKLPRLRRERMFPISIRALDPINVGVEQGPLYPTWVYHRYKSTISDVMQQWGNELRASTSPHIISLLDDYDNEEGEDAEVTVIDYWWIDDNTGKVWNAVLVDDDFVKKPSKTKYPDLPIIVGRGDYAPGLGDDYDGLSILHPLHGSWEAQCRIASLMATGLLWYFWPAILTSGAGVELDIGPGITTPIAQDQDIRLLQINPDVPLAQAVFQQLDQHIQQSSYPEVMYGKAPGDLQAGYGVSLLSDAAEGRIKNFREGLEIAFSQLNSMILGIISVFAPPEGVTIWGYDERDKRKYSLTITKDIIGENYENEVSLKPVIPSAMMQMQTLGIRLADARYISKQTLRDKFLDIPVPSDEEARIMREELLDSDELRGYRLRQAAIRWKPKDWLRILAGNPMAQQLLPQVPGYHWTVDGELEPDEQQGPGAIPPQMPPEAMMPGQGMQQQPGMPPQMMQQGMPQQGPPPQMMQQGPPPQGMPQQGPPPVQPGMAVPGPDGAGGPIPPAMQGLMEPGMLNAQAQANPMAFAALMGKQLSPEEELIRLAGMIPPKE